MLKKEITGLKESKIEIKQFPEGTYRGPLVNGKATGHGVLTYKKDDRFGRISYEGDFKDNKKHGKGTHKLANGVSYVGEFKDDKAHGQGTMKWTAGSYEGEWKDDKYNGHGTLKWPDGKSYEGEWKDGYKHGQGTMKWTSGRSYIGEWSHSCMTPFPYI